ncbi:uncharacterized protein EHS24_002260 [Apiotrichum porosum]|uniref:Uncharacterized protein n=1 Tax=Apiotrichum porosum TaxID=105984 RepID=A0A427XI29_9TREE|nr:uncharacterized protein EHS24_002260 [Apiotrichum porosum]RSH78535.1 hypothetical protein EHS24_002260 [Apiotrichum porosum]
MIIPLSLLCDSNRTESDSSDDGTCDGDNSGNNEGEQCVPETFVYHGRYVWRCKYCGYYVD